MITRRKLIIIEIVVPAVIAIPMVQWFWPFAERVSNNSIALFMFITMSPMIAMAALGHFVYDPWKARRNLL